MAKTYTADELNKLDGQELTDIVLSLQEQVDSLSASYERLIEQIRIAEQVRFGRRSEKLDVIDGQFSLFDEAEAFSDPEAPEPEAEEVVQAYKRKKRKGKREEDLSGFPEESFNHPVSKEELDAFFGEGNWRAFKPDVYKRLRYLPATWKVEVHTVEVYVGTGGDHEDEFLRGQKPKYVIPNSIETPSLGGAILNGKYVNALPLNRISQEFDRNGLTLSRQTMANWVIQYSQVFSPLWERMKKELLTLPVVQCDETPTLVINDGTPTPGRKSYMWVHRSGEFIKDKVIILYEYQKTRHHIHPLEFYKDYQGILETDGLQQYHLVEQKVEGLTNANCWAHARRDFADACKAMDKKNVMAYKASVAHQALELIAKIYQADEKLKELSPEERLRRRTIEVSPLVEAFFAWVREQLASKKLLPKGKTVEGLNYCLNQEKNLKVFLLDGNVPIDNSASERAIRPFCVGKKNWVLINSIKGANASAICYSLAESAKANGLKPYYYFVHLLTELPKQMDENGNIDSSKLDDLLPFDCYDLEISCRDNSCRYPAALSFRGNRILPRSHSSPKIARALRKCLSSSDSVEKVSVRINPKRNSSCPIGYSG